MMKIVGSTFLFVALLGGVRRVASFQTTTTPHQSSSRKRAARSPTSHSLPKTRMFVVPKGVTFQYSPSSLQHLEAIELPDDDTTAASGWSTQKSIALTGALVVSSVFCVLTEYILVEYTPGLKGSSFFISGPFAALGWFVFGGEEARQAEKPKNGGKDGKFVVDVPSRLYKIIQEIPSSSIIQSSESKKRDKSELMRLAQSVHSEEYLQQLQDAVAVAKETDRPHRLYPSYARTLIDQHSYDAALSAVADWRDAVDAGLEGKPTFALVRPPSHHACRTKGMGGCLLNGAAIAAFYALNEKGAKKVAILDMDAHFGNGIAHCVQDDPRIKYVSLHEDLSGSFYMVPKKRSKEDPRGPEADDRGPMGNLLNIPLKKGTGWDTGYKEALEYVALPWLCGEGDDKPDILLVAAGFDALEADATSSFVLQPQDYAQIGVILEKQFGNRVAFGLEGGYCWENGELSQAVLEFVKPWQS